MREIYSVGDTLRSGHEVINIYGDTGYIAVVETPGGVRWEVTSGPKYSASIFEEFHRIHCTIPSGVSKEMRETLNKQLAAALFNALTSDNKKEALGAFEAVRLRINKVLTPAQVKVCFYGFTIMSSSAIALCFYLLSLICSQTLVPILYCGIAGVLGSTLSALQRSTDIALAEDEGLHFILFQSSIISVIGLLSGLCIYLVSNSDLAFTFAKENVYNLLTLSVISGFGERFIPDLFEKIKH